MEKITDILERAQLRGFGAFLMDGGGELWDCPEDGFSAEELLHKGASCYQIGTASLLDCNGAVTHR